MKSSQAASAPEGILFDVDGTLVDSNYAHVSAWFKAFQLVGHAVPAWRIHRSIGMDSTRLLRELLGEDASRLGDEAERRHSELYREDADSLVALPGARELIAALSEREIRVVLATSAPTGELELLRSVLDVDELITAATSADDVQQAKPDPGIVQVAQQRSGCRTDQLLFVGDAVWDMQAAGRAGIAAVGVRSGGISDSELRDAGARAVYDDVAALLAALESGQLKVG